MKAIDPDSAEWYTPPDLLDRIYAVLPHIDLDPCSNPGKPLVRADTHYRKEDDGLSQTWQGVIYMNPPYGREIGKWTGKLVDEFTAGNVPAAVALLPVKSDTVWWADLMEAAPVWCAIRGRVKFQSPTGFKQTGTFASAAVLLTEDPGCIGRFVQAFGDLGTLWRRWD